jgi:hypothetical protein
MGVAVVFGWRWKKSLNVFHEYKITKGENMGK